MSLDVEVASDDEIAGLSARGKRRLKLRESGLAALMLAPSIAIFVTFIFLPFARTISATTKLADPFGGPGKYVGFSQISEVISSPAFRNSLSVTGRFVLLTVPPGLLFGVILALMAHQRLRGIAVFRSIFSSTIATSVAVAAVMFLTLFNQQVGLIPRLMEWQDRVPLMRDPNWALVLVAVATVWQNLGFTFIVILAALQTVPDDLLEAAEVDGAGPLRRLFFVLIPELRRSFAFVITVLTIASFQAFGQIELITQGGPGESTNALVYSVYQDAFVRNNDGVAAVQALALFVIVLVVTSIQLRYLERRTLASG